MPEIKRLELKRRKRKVKVVDDAPERKPQHVHFDANVYDVIVAHANQHERFITGEIEYLVKTHPEIAPLL